MGKINGWDRLLWRTIAEAEENLDANGRGELAVWTNGAWGRVEYLYEPDAERPFLLRVRGTNRDFPEEGRYETREAGGNANKAIMRRYP